MIAEKFSLAGKTALITGSSQGIGKGIALAFAEYGANIILHCKTDKNEAEEVANEVKGIGVDVHIIQADLSHSGAAADLYQKVSEIVEQLDILVINASAQIPARWTEVSDNDIDIQVNTNFKSTFQLMQQFAPGMAETGWGRILTIGSVQQTRPHPSMIIYAALKSAVLNLVQNLAMQLADKGVTVNNLAPGVIATPRLDEDVPEPEERINKRLETPSGNLGNPEDCAAMALLLCSAAGNFITGQNIYVDGGLSL
ncbi:SDR family NAD(P)-dependent oxidoreductase [Dyadobacter sp. NIV53]|uniref:SDR family NAD(P)-dependent oxidoreductase n=1 Tax=Dyadobacter sp. NIV53 TaxID=2861765 RepID=UPI001C878B2D|nr:SDR family oxidoreductase [Dyadobacter sp. NIV53]